ncbi:DUF6191 domain-containing protein [Nocardia sp. NPDC059180]|uniref:DUF6191 domain-containing protein n=1 Tax=Nocardia sp. NPDC059180 TaxID=3346761 RepID=UPI0036BC1DE2
MQWVIGGAVLVIIGLVVDQIGFWAERRGWIYWRRRRPEPSGGGGVAGMFGEMQALLSPSYRHTISEVEAKKTLRVDLATGDDHPVVVDLDGNTVVLRPPSPQ